MTTATTPVAPAAAPAAPAAPATPLTAAAALTDPPAAAAAPAAPAAATAAAPAGAGAPADPTHPQPIAVPGKDATPEQWKTFYRELGAPEKGDGYQLPLPEGQDGAFLQTAAGWMAEAGLLPQQAKMLAEKWNAHVAELQTLSTTKAAEAEAAEVTRKHTENVRQEQQLRAEWGSNYDAHIGQAKLAIAQFMRPIAGDKTADVITALEASLGYAGVVKLFHTIGKGLGTAQGHGLQSGGHTQTDQAMTAGERMILRMRAEREASEAARSQAGS